MLSDMNDESGEMWEEVFIIFWHSCGRSEENHFK